MPVVAPTTSGGHESGVRPIFFFAFICREFDLARSWAVDEEDVRSRGCMLLRCKLDRSKEDNTTLRLMQDERKVGFFSFPVLFVVLTMHACLNRFRH